MEAGAAVSDKHLIEIGWLVVGHFDRGQLETVDRARERVKRALSRRFPDFEWRLPLARRERPARGMNERPVVLLEQGIGERHLRAWDYAFLVTEADLRGYERPFMYGVPSRAVNVAVLSTARLDPRASGDKLPEPERSRVSEDRILSLVMHLFGHLNGLEHDRSESSFMFDFRDAQDLERMTEWTEAAARELEEELAVVADPRLEETTPARGRLSFYLGAARLNWKAIVKAVASAKPWLLPIRLSRFTTAASSAAVILLVTAETWDLAFSQELGTVPLLAGMALAATASLIVMRQRLIHPPAERGLTEQMVVANIAVVASVVIGLVTTFTALSLVTLLAAWSFFPHELVER